MKYQRRVNASLSLLTAALVACSSGAAPNSASPRTYRLGFSGTPPRLTTESVLQTIEAWRPHADIAQITQRVAWRALLADTSAAELVRRDIKELAAIYHGRGLPLIVMIDVTIGITREREPPVLVWL